MKYCIAIVVFFLFSFVQAQTQKLPLLIGTYTNSCDSKGIYVYDFDTNTGDFVYKNATEKVINPSYLALSKDQKIVYSVNENGAESTVSSFQFDSGSGKLTELNKQKAEGADPCYIINDDNNVIVANYSGGNIAVFGKNTKGSLTEAKQVLQHKGKGIHPRQGGAHVHMVYFSPDKKYILSNDLGTDAVYIYEYHPNAASEIMKFKSTVTVESGSGPRHLTFSKDGKFVYLLQELNGALSVFSFANGQLHKIQETTILAKDFKGNFTGADIHISPDGKFLYASNRGEANTISIFKILKNGQLQTQSVVSSLGKGPRNFVIDPTGKFLLVAHQYSNEVVVFKRDTVSGAIIDSGKRLELCSPVCMVFGN
ncbi:lactonase family protein [Flavobacterium ammonificans]|uniref:6-phosphogluconolactonase n=1 Tax=Flavobacterium ammonificans TaxID=1751056 RepID=A0ABM7V2L2_9FLAO|nr:lactonase family protein [Flavobacterium ammonificans]BDB52874.1 6-phosphogluconolactonase [Flavobacterium ammonificans]